MESQKILHTWHSSLIIFQPPFIPPIFTFVFQIQTANIFLRSL